MIVEHVVISSASVPLDVDSSDCRLLYSDYVGTNIPDSVDG